MKNPSFLYIKMTDSLIQKSWVSTARYTQLANLQLFESVQLQIKCLLYAFTDGW